MNSSMIQRQLKLNAGILCEAYSDQVEYRWHRKKYNDEADMYAKEALDHAEKEDYAMAGNVKHLADECQQLAACYTPFINKLSKRIKALEQLQKALKKSLQEAYWQEHFAKTYEPLPHDEDDFLHIRQAEIITKEGVPVPTWQDGCVVDE